MKLLFIALILLIINNPCIAQEDEEIIRRIYDELLVNSEVYENLEYLTKEIGPRLSGSSNLNSAIEYTKDLMLNYDFDTVYLQPVMASNWKRGDKEFLEVINAKTNFNKNLNCVALGNSIGTDKSGKIGELIEIHGVKALEEASNEQIKGKIVFLNEPFDKKLINTFEAYSKVSAQREYGTSLASSKGAVGVIIRSLSISKNAFPHTGYMEYKLGVAKIPAVAISTIDANYLSEQLKENPELKASIILQCETFENVLSYNVIGELKGEKHPGSIIVVGGHIDSWDIGEGAHDNGGGCLQSIEVLKTFKDLNITPKHTIRAVLWTDEENSWAGNIEYAKKAKSSKEKHIAAIESDRGSFAPLGFYIETENAKAYENVMSWKQLFEPYWVDIFQRGHAGVDVSPLKDNNILLLGLLTDCHKYFTIHHSEKDIFEEVDKRELELGAAALTSIVYLIDKYGVE